MAGLREQKPQQHGEELLSQLHGLLAVVGEDACSTVLKACLDESHVLPEPVEASADGLSLKPWKGEELTVGNELDKLAANIAIGRDFAGIHWRSDAYEGLKLGEEIAIQMLREIRLTGNELFAGSSLRRFDGRRILVGGRGGADTSSGSAQRAAQRVM